MCNAQCCRALSVPLDDADVHRLRRASGLAPGRFLESVEGAPIALPLVQPYLLARTDGRCALLGPGLGCTCYEGRPAACRQYPHQVLFYDVETVRPVPPRPEDIAGIGPRHDAATRVIPLLIRHRECPGFTGPPLSTQEWIVLVRETVALQYPTRESAASATVDGMGNDR